MLCLWDLSAPLLKATFISQPKTFFPLTSSPPSLSLPSKEHITEEHEDRASERAVPESANDALSSCCSQLKIKVCSGGVLPVCSSVWKRFQNICQPLSAQDKQAFFFFLQIGGMKWSASESIVLFDAKLTVLQLSFRISSSRMRKMFFCKIPHTSAQCGNSCRGMKLAHHNKG